MIRLNAAPAAHSSFGGQEFSEPFWDRNIAVIGLVASRFKYWYVSKNILIHSATGKFARYLQSLDESSATNGQQH
jgi:hypothetical protein